MKITQADVSKRSAEIDEYHRGRAVTVSGMKEAFEQLPNCHNWVNLQEQGGATVYKVSAPTSSLLDGPHDNYNEYTFQPVEFVKNRQRTWEWQLINY